MSAKPKKKPATNAKRSTKTTPSVSPVRALKAHKKALKNNPYRIVLPEPPFWKLERGDVLDPVVPTSLSFSTLCGTEVTFMLEYTSTPTPTTTPTPTKDSSVTCDTSSFPKAPCESSYGAQGLGKWAAYAIIEGFTTPEDIEESRQQTTCDSLNNALMLARSIIAKNLSATVEEYDERLDALGLKDELPDFVRDRFAPLRLDVYEVSAKEAEKAGVAFDAKNEKVRRAVDAKVDEAAAKLLAEDGGEGNEK